MGRMISIVLVSVVALLLAATTPLRAPLFGPLPHATLSIEKLSPIDGFLKGEVAAGHIPGACVLVQQHAKLLYKTCVGVRDPDTGAPLTEDSIFPIHSVTKTITSVAAMMLVDRGKIALDDPVAKYIPSFAGMKVGVERPDESGKPVLGF